MLILKLNHVSKRGTWKVVLVMAVRMTSHVGPSREIQCYAQFNHNNYNFSDRSTLFIYDSCATQPSIMNVSSTSVLRHRGTPLNYFMTSSLPDEKSYVYNNNKLLQLRLLRPHRNTFSITPQATFINLCNLYMYDLYQNTPASVLSSNEGQSHLPAFLQSYLKKTNPCVLFFS